LGTWKGFDNMLPRRYWLLLALAAAPVAPLLLYMPLLLSMPLLPQLLLL
jgi:hypothetical protein